jgi:hypothetical protein
VLGLASIAVLLAVATSCSSSRSVSPYVIRVSPTSAVVAEGRAVILQASGSPPATREFPYSWQSVGSLVAGVFFSWDLDFGAMATVEAWAAGTSEVRVHNYGYSADGYASAQITVFAVSAKTLAVLPETSTIDVGGFALLFPVVRDSVDVSLLRTGFEWSSSDPAIAQVTWVPSWGFGGNGTCRVDGVSSGDATITARVEGLTAHATVTVRPPGPSSSPAHSPPRGP